MAILRFVHGSIDIEEELHKLMASGIELAVGDENSGVPIGHGANNEDADEDHAESGEDAPFDGECPKPINGYAPQRFIRCRWDTSLLGPQLIDR